MAFSPNGRTVVAANHGESRSTLYWVDVGSGQVIGSVEIESAYPMAVALAPDGRFLASNGTKGVNRLDQAQLLGGTAPVAAAELPGLWDEMNHFEAARAYRARCRLVLAGSEAVSMLRGKLRPVREAQADQIGRLLKDLASDNYVVRHRAMQGLETLGEAAAPALDHHLKSGPSLEVMRRIESLKATHVNLRQDWSIEILEAVGDDSARLLLKEIATGLPDARVTRNARSAFDRLVARNARR